MTARVIAKMSCWSREKMVGSDLQFYITWLKDQLKLNVMSFLCTLIVEYQDKCSLFYRITNFSIVWCDAYK